MHELRRRFAPRSWRSASTWTATWSPCGAMTASPERRRRRVGAGKRTARRDRPDFFIVGHPKCGTTALYEMLRRHPQIFMPELKEPRFFARDLHPRLAHARHASADARGVPRAVRARPRRDAARRGGVALLSALASAAAARSPSCGPTRASSRCLREPASFLRSLHLRAGPETTSRPSRTCAALRSSTSVVASRGTASEPGLRLLRPRPLRRAAAPLRGSVRRGADARADLRRLSHRQRGDGAPRASLSRRRGLRSRSRSIEANPTVRCARCALYEAVRSLYLGERTDARRRSSARSSRSRRSALGARCATCCAARRSTRQPRRAGRAS